jgi:hypothetical protein
MLILVGSDLDLAKSLGSFRIRIMFQIQIRNTDWNNSTKQFIKYNYAAHFAKHATGPSLGPAAAEKKCNILIHVYHVYTLFWKYSWIISFIFSVEDILKIL